MGSIPVGGAKRVKPLGLTLLASPTVSIVSITKLQSNLCKGSIPEIKPTDTEKNLKINAKFTHFLILLSFFYLNLEQFSKYDIINISSI